MLVEAATERETQKIREWLLAILRFAVTRENVDRDLVLAIAADMDRLGPRFCDTRFTYFVRTSVAFCDAILAGDSPERAAVLRAHIKWIDDERLRSALEKILHIHPPRKPRRPNRAGLFRGLPTKLVQAR